VLAATPPDDDVFSDIFGGAFFFVLARAAALEEVLLLLLSLVVFDFPRPSLSVNRGFLLGGGFDPDGDDDDELPGPVADMGGVFPREAAPAARAGGVFPLEMVAPVARPAGCLILIFGLSPLPPPSLILSLGSDDDDVTDDDPPPAIFFSIFCCSLLAILSICWAGLMIHLVVSLSLWYRMAFSKIRLQSSYTCFRLE